MGFNNLSSNQYPGKGKETGWCSGVVLWLVCQTENPARFQITRFQILTTPAAAEPEGAVPEGRAAARAEGEHPGGAPLPQ